MSETSARLLALLSLLQTPREWSGGELAERLGVSRRTIRRDVERLRDLGYPVQATMGADGGYRLGAGAAMPPLLLDDEEAVAIAVGLRTAAAHAVGGIEEASVRALAKLEQVLPSRLRYRVGALTTATVPMLAWNRPTVEPAALTLLATAIANRERLRFAYRGAGGAESRRHLEPHRLVSAGRRWYLVGFDLDRNDWRIFRVDRISAPAATGARITPRKLPAEDAAAFVTRTLSGLAPVYRAEATLHAPIERMAARLGDGAVDLEPIDEHSCRLRGHTDTLDWLALRLATLGCEFEVHEPPELIDYLRALCDRVSRAAGTAEGPSPRPASATRRAPRRPAGRA
ncbi:MAG TPA: YafY family protein [Actinophytocola sp.]|uniref:helix-turn-helix transcriptional regulator n=1 Tax=Actinophytocola sp. TaxID=1872138 RepID=UPI002DDC90EB|nr:YafY family protein [Actinophytocola sp.]HEV2782955.1 YafY family protein [Actinophytocola sp.]